MNFTFKRLLAIVLCSVMICSALPLSASAASSDYSLVSNTGDELQMPTKKQFLDSPVQAAIKASREGGYIEIMPKPKAGNGKLGTIDDGERVTILAEADSFFFFMDSIGQMGWNGKKYFKVGLTGSNDEFEKDYSIISTTGVQLEYPGKKDYLDKPFTAEVKASRENGSIYIMPKPKDNTGNLGEVDDGEYVTILAETKYYYFFMTEDERYGWNGKKFFTKVSSAGMSAANASPVGNDGLNTSQLLAISDFLSGSDCGRASADFYADCSVVILGVNEKRNVGFHGAYTATYYIEVVSGNSADAYWADNSFDALNNAEIVVSGLKEGNTIIELSNSKTNETFRILICVM